MAATTIATMAMLKANCLSTKAFNTSKPMTSKPIQNVPKGLIASKPLLENLNLSSSLAGTAIAGAIFSTLSSCDAAFAAQQIAEIAEGDNRGLALLLPVVPAIAWVLYNILQPALNQINKMRSVKGAIIGVGLGGLAASGGLLYTPHASAAGSEMAVLAEAAAASTDNRGTLLLLVISPAIAWVLYNILQPALNQINKMRN
ncbi:hypothetical protein RJ640_030738 [Escallonia rubra]|uniref:Uncharacterized protein n=1 Tax=Escallonia rubra TaxID=112253 RepID=A0AA88U5G1_9ASTE|nr:hypothetical protein RJ640_030738 [Escallonia rubra]